MEKQHKEQCIKMNIISVKSLSDCIYSIATLQCKVCLMSTKGGKFIKSYKIM